MKHLIFTMLPALCIGCAGIKKNQPEQQVASNPHGLISPKAVAADASSRYALKHDIAPMPESVPNLKNVQLIKPKPEPKSKHGNPKSYVINNKRYHVMKTNLGYKEEGIASWYGQKFHGFKTSNGETYNMFSLSAAHKTLPLPTYAEVTNLSNGKKIVVRINDRGPFHGNRIIDLSYAAAHKLDILGNGTAKVAVKSVFNQQDVDVVDIEQQQQKNQQQIYLQFGAFSCKTKAQLLSEKLGKNYQQFPVYVSSIIHDPGRGVELHRVRMGPFKDDDEADTFIKDLKFLDSTGTANSINLNITTADANTKQPLAVKVKG